MNLGQARVTEPDPPVTESVYRLCVVEVPERVTGRPDCITLEDLRQLVANSFDYPGDSVVTITGAEKSTVFKGTKVITENVTVVDWREVPRGEDGVAAEG